MSRIRSPRLAVAAVALVALLPLSGCLAAQIPQDVPAPDPSESSAPSETPDDSDDSGSSSDTLTFDEGADLTTTSYIQWGDGFVVSDEWTIASPDDGNGNWSYAKADGTCKASFWQGLTGPGIVVPGDDSASTDAVIATFLGGTPADITPNARTGSLSYQVGGNDGVEARQVTGAESGRTWIMTARAFGEAGAAVYVIVDCAGSLDVVEAALDEVTEKNAVIVAP